MGFFSVEFELSGVKQGNRGKSWFEAMEKLNSLGSSLPPERSPTDQAIESLSGELSQEFKIAANAVTKLYRVANERNSLLKHRGYLQCVEDLLAMLQQEPGLSVEDIHLWCLKQRGEMLSHPNGEGKNGANKYNFEFGGSGDQSRSTTPAAPVFRLSTPPLSVEHSKPDRTGWSVQRQQTWKGVPCNHQERLRDEAAAGGSEDARVSVLPAPVKKQKVVTTVVTPSRRKAKTDRRDER